MGYTKKTTHVIEGLANLVDQFKNKPRLAALVTSFLTQIQELEDALAQIETDTTTTTAVGQQLDNLGAIVGEARLGRSDLQYDTAIQVRRLLNVSEGTIEDVHGLIQAVAGVPIAVEITERFPAGYHAAILDPLDDDTVNTAQIGVIVASGRPAGVLGSVTFFSTGAFRYDVGPGFDTGKYAGAVSA